jgi:hypothetical protein
MNKNSLWDMTTQEVLNKWDKGESIWSVEMGGLGPNYELAIQEGIFDILRELFKQKLNKKTLLDNKRWSKKYEDLVFKALKEKDHSGATAGAAQQVAYRFYVYGYKYMMDKSPEDRRIQVSKLRSPK